MCRWLNGDVSFVSARTKEDAIVMLDEWDNAEGAEISQIRDFMVDFRLNDEGDLELAEFGESCRDAILEKAYPRLLEAMPTAPTTPIRRHYSRRQGDAPQSSTGGTNAPASSRPVCLSLPTEAAKTSRRRWVPLRRTRIEPLKRWPLIFSTRLLAQVVSSSCSGQRRFR